MKKLNKRLICHAALPYMLGCVCVIVKAWWIFLLALIALIYLILPLIRVGDKKEYSLRIIIIFSFYFLGFFNFSIKYDQISNKAESFSKGSDTVELLTVTEKKHDNRTMICGDAIIYCSGAGAVKYGSVISVKGIVYPLEKATNEGQFDSFAMNISRGVTHSIFVEDISDITIKKEPVFDIREVMYELSEKINISFDRALPADKSALIKAMAMGDKSFMEDEDYELFKRSGIAHVLVVSGFHISLIGMGIFKLLLGRVRHPIAVGLSAAVVALYGIMTGMGVSAMRAVFMFILFLCAKLLGEGYDATASISAVFLLMLVLNPLLLLSSGFILSFYQTWMIVHLSQITKKVKGEKLIFSVMVPVMGYPVIASFFYEISFASLMLNLLILPLMGAVMFLSLSAGVIGIFIPIVSDLLLKPVELCLGIDVFLCDLFDSFNFLHVICGKPDTVRLVIYFILLIAVFEMIKCGRGIAGVLFSFPLFVSILVFPHKRSFEIDMLDVGQGDGIYICSAEGVSMFIDGGSTDCSAVGKYRLAPFFKCRGLERIDYWFVSHFDSDHVSGFLECIEEGYEVSHVVLSEHVMKDEAYEDAMKILDKNDAEVIFLGRGDVLNMGETRIRCLGTDERADCERNARSMCLYYEDGDISAFFGGDISNEEEEILLSDGALGPVSIYKASHHGSNYSNSEAILEALDPDLCIISAGVDNRYSHPGADTLSRLEDKKIPYFCTIDKGMIKIKKEGSKIGVDFWK